MDNCIVILFFTFLNENCELKLYIKKNFNQNFKWGNNSKVNTIYIQWINTLAVNRSTSVGNGGTLTRLPYQE